MSFGGSVSAMLSSLKNNSRKKRKTIFEREDGHAHSGRNLNHLLNKKATPEQLAEIKRKLDAQNKKARKKNLIILIMVVVFIVLSFIFLNH